MSDEGNCKRPRVVQIARTTPGDPDQEVWHPDKGVATMRLAIDDPIRVPGADGKDPLLYPHQYCSYPEKQVILHMQDDPGKEVPPGQKLLQEFEACLVCFDAGPSCGVAMGCFNWRVNWTHSGSDWTVGGDPVTKKPRRTPWGSASPIFTGLTDELVRQRCEMIDRGLGSSPEKAQPALR